MLFAEAWGNSEELLLQHLRTDIGYAILDLKQGILSPEPGVSDGKCCSTAHVMCEVVFEIAPCLLRWAAGMMRRLVRVSRIVAIYTYLYIRRGVIIGLTKAMLEKRKSRFTHILAAKLDG